MRLRQAKEKAAEILALSGKARTKSIQLQEVDFAGDLSAKLLEYAVWGEKAYLQLMKASDKDVKGLLDLATKKDKWYGDAEAGRSWTDLTPLPLRS